MCLLTEKMSIGWKCAYWMKMCLLIENVLIDRKCAYWPKGVYWIEMCLLTENVLIENESQNCSVFLNVYVALIYIAMWHNKKRSTKS